MSQRKPSAAGARLKPVGHIASLVPRTTRHARACPGHPRPSVAEMQIRIGTNVGYIDVARTWMAGTSARSKASSPCPAMTENRNKRTQANAALKRDTARRRSPRERSVPQMERVRVQRVHRVGRLLRGARECSLETG